MTLGFMDTAKQGEFMVEITQIHWPPSFSSVAGKFSLSCLTAFTSLWGMTLTLGASTPMSYVSQVPEINIVGSLLTKLLLDFKILLGQLSPIKQSPTV